MGLNTQQDPIGIAGGLNLYGYANGDPINFSDPFGLCAQADTVEVEVAVNCPQGPRTEKVKAAVITDPAAIQDFWSRMAERRQLGDQGMRRGGHK